MTGKRKSAGNVKRAGRSEADLGQKEAELEKTQAEMEKVGEVQPPYGRRQSSEGRSPAEGHQNSVQIALTPSADKASF
jgi:hypothetical protein